MKKTWTRKFAATLIFLATLCFGEVLLAAVPATLNCAHQDKDARLRYMISALDRDNNIAHVSVQFEGTGTTRNFVLPVWNALYEVRDFSVNVMWLAAHDAAGQPLAVKKLDKTTWQVGPSTGCGVIEYDIQLNDAGPFGAQVNDRHAFLNLAQVLVYSNASRRLPATVTLADIPKEWKAIAALPTTEDTQSGAWTFRAPSYDALVDAPIEAGTFQLLTWTDNGAKYRTVIDAIPGDYDAKTVQTVDEKIERAETEWMHDRPYSEYTFIYHFPRGPGGGGMEHANCTAIDVSASRLNDGTLGFASVTAHEFFHLWNVKRIRPQSLEPVDYTKENYTRALWFSEGMTSTVAEHILVRAGLMNDQQFLRRLADQIEMLEARPARLTQSVEESSLDTWLDKYPAYNQPDRSISYYNKGQILGEMLDLAMLRASNGTRSIRDLFQYMNEHWAKRGKYFDDSASVQQAAETLTGADFGSFFRNYVAGVTPIPYDDFFSTVGLRLVKKSVAAPYPGFMVSGRTGGALVVSRVSDGSDAQQAGVQPGDVIAGINGRPAMEFLSQLENAKPGDMIMLSLRGAMGERELKVRMGARMLNRYLLEDLPDVSAAQMARRAAWIHGDDEAAVQGKAN